MFVFIIVFKKYFVPAYFPGLWKKKNALQYRRAYKNNHVRAFYN